MTWWQVALVFAGIPAGVFILIWVTVSLLSQARVPDGLAEVQEHPDIE